MDFILMCFDVLWFWLGRIIGGLFSLAIVIAIFLTILEFVWLRTETVWKSISRFIQRTKLFVEFLRWKRNQ